VTIKLSICIPTYNREKFLESTLSNIVPQLKPGVEIVIMDGASTDNTQFIIEKWKALCPAIKFFRGERNGGVDSDLAACIEHAEGEYCWLMSSDDFFAKEALTSVMEEIASSDLGVLIGCRIDCSTEMKPLMFQSWIPGAGTVAVFSFSKPADFIAYFDKIKSIGALFSYIPCIVVHRNSWLQIIEGRKFYGTNYAHVFCIFEILKRGGKLKYIEKALVLCRMGNDSFSSEGLVKRYQIDFRGYSQITRGLFNENPDVLAAMLRVITKEHRWPRLLKIRAHCRNRSEWNEIKEQLLEFGYSRNLLFLCGLFGSLKPAITLSQFLWATFRKYRWRCGKTVK
jgi:abequosyltransferase